MAISTLMTGERRNPPSSVPPTNGLPVLRVSVTRLLKPLIRFDGSPRSARTVSMLLLPAEEIGVSRGSVHGVSQFPSSTTVRPETRSFLTMIPWTISRASLPSMEVMHGGLWTRRICSLTSIKMKLTSGRRALIRWMFGSIRARAGPALPRAEMSWHIPPTSTSRAATNIVGGSRAVFLRVLQPKERHRTRRCSRMALFWTRRASRCPSRLVTSSIHCM
mmetsp:Transcript_11683/g.33239  ORF Transcript_11683/g.33239 Transcript_11683/m.33239 type:complete len:219 (+) Transcript_11683:1565-2221(+)